MGIEGEEILNRYARALEATYKLLRAHRWKDPAKGNKIRVYVFDTTRYLRGGIDAPFSHPDPDGPVIGLRSAINEPSRRAMLQRAAIEAVHETTHAFNHAARPPDWTCPADPWKWFDEATAVFMERQVYPRHPEGLRFALHWAYRPELELESGDAPGGYCAAWFIDYLVTTFGWGLLHAAWHDSDPTGRKRPTNVLDDLLRRDHNVSLGEVFGGRGRPTMEERQRRRGLRTQRRRQSVPGCCCCPAGPGDGDFCDDNYCTRVYSTHCFAPSVHDRFGGRSVTASVEVAAGALAAPDATARLGPLSCRYYRLYPKEARSAVRVRLTVQAPPSRCRLSAALLPVVATHQVGPTVFLSQGSAEGDAQQTSFEGVVAFPTPPQGHVVLVVANTRVTPAEDPPDPDDCQLFSFAASGAIVAPVTEPCCESP
jgi:hypothetical protein